LRADQGYDPYQIDVMVRMTEGVLDMQISRHWRMNATRYRLEGVRYETGAVSLQERPVAHQETTNQDKARAGSTGHKSKATAAA
jgi:hypothetical protein